MHNHSKVSKYYEQDCFQILLSLFIPLLTALIVKNNHILAEIYCVSLKNDLEKPEGLSTPNLDLSEKMGKEVIKKDKF